MFYLRIILMVFLAGCAAKKQNDYQLWSSKPTPDIWKQSSIWNIVMVDKNGIIIRNLTIKFTDEIATENCSSGNFKKIKIISETPKRSEFFMGLPAYEIKGSALTIDLSANLCDAGYELQGSISEMGVEGYHQPVTMLGGEVVGRFYGVPVVIDKRVSD